MAENNKERDTFGPSENKPNTPSTPKPANTTDTQKGDAAQRPNTGSPTSANQGAGVGAGATANKTPNTGSGAGTSGSGTGAGTTGQTGAGGAGSTGGARPTGQTGTGAATGGTGSTGIGGGAGTTGGAQTQTHTSGAEHKVAEQQWGQGHTSQHSSPQSYGQSESPMEQVRQKAAPMVDDAKQQASEAVNMAQQRALGMIDEQKGRAAETLNSVASALRTTGQQLNEQKQGNFGQYAERAAETVDQFAQQLQNKDLGEILDDVQRFARREPQIFLGGAVLAGILLARFLKSSAPEPDYSGSYNMDQARNYGNRGYGQPYGRSYQPGGYRQGYRMQDRRSIEPLDQDYDESWTGEDFYPGRGTGSIR